MEKRCRLYNFAGNMKKGKAYIWAAGAGLLVLMIAADLAGGGEAGAQVLLHLRTPRVLTALLAGASLALAGGQMQSVLRNPLADPHIMGVSAGAALGAALATMLGGHSLPGGHGGLPQRRREAGLLRRMVGVPLHLAAQQHGHHHPGAGGADRGVDLSPVFHGGTLVHQQSFAHEYC